MAAAAVAAAVFAMMLCYLPEIFAGGDVHHVVGGDRGWDRASNVSDWSAGRVFRVGDKIWFSYSAAEEGVVEVKSREEYEKCDIRKPLRLLKNGVDIVFLGEEGMRFFTSRNWNSCKQGLKLDVAVLPHRIEEKVKETAAMAAGPAAPSSSRYMASPYPFVFLLFIPLLLGSFC